jgi:hypothetical protein
MMLNYSRTKPMNFMKNQDTKLSKLSKKENIQFRENMI